MNAWREKLPDIAMMIVLIIMAQACVRTPAAVDFRAFYCAGAAVTAGADPYRVEPLRTCENRLTDRRETHPPGSVIPAPLPGYDFALFGLLAALPYQQAEILWQFGIWSCLIITACALKLLTRQAFPLIVVTLFFTDGYLPSLNGQIAPLATAAVALGAYFLSRKRYTLAATAAIAAMCEPHIALGPIIALFIIVRETRAALFVGFCCLGMLTVLMTGITQTREYLLDVLPLHVRSEVSHVGQYSLTHLLHVLGVSDSVALPAGACWYAAMLVIGIIAVRRLRTVPANHVLTMTIPPLFTLIGGPFAHIWHMAAALPAALILYDRFPRARKISAWALVLLATPWSDFSVMQKAQPYAALCLLYMVWRLSGNLIAGAAAAAGQLVTLSAATLLAPREGGKSSPLPAVTVAPKSYSEFAWQPVVMGAFSKPALLSLIFHLPTWCGLLLLASIAWRGALITDAPMKTPYSPCDPQ